MAVKICCIEKCKSSTLRKEDDGVTYHKFPNDSKLKLVWLESTKVVQKNDLNLYVCSRHFCKLDYKLYMDTKYILRADAVPSIFPWNMEESTVNDSKMEPDNLPTKPEDFGEFELNVNKSKQIGTGNNVCDPPTILLSSNNSQISNVKDNGEKVSEQSTMALSVGSKVEAKNFGGVWFSAEIGEVDYDELEVLVQYDDIKKQDEWISVSSPRLRPYIEKPKIPSSPINGPSLNYSFEMPLNKRKLKFKVGERCLAKWNNGKFVATIQKELDDDQYEVMFDDGVLLTCKFSKLSKLKQVKNEFEPQPSTSSAAFTQLSPSKTHRHLFDPSRDYLGTKSERREKKRKLNIKALFNIGQTKRKFSKTHKQNTKIISMKKSVAPSASDKANLTRDIEMIERDSPEPECKLENFEQINEEKHEETLCQIKEVIIKLEKSLSQNNSEVESVASPMLTEIKEEYVKEEEVDKEEVDKEKVDKKEVDKEKVDKEEVDKEEVDQEEVDPKEAKPKDVKVKIEIDQLPAGEIKKEPIKLVISLPPDQKFKKMSKIRRAKKLRMIREKMVKEEMEKVKSELEEMKRQVLEMKQQVNIKKESSSPMGKNSGRISSNQSYLLPGEWCCKWVGNQPEGVVYENERIDHSKTVQRLAIQVFDKRLPSGWIKLLVRRSIGTSAGKWDVSFVCPDGRKIHTKSEMRAYLELQNNPDLKPYEYALLDFGIHRKLSRRLGWDDEIPVVPVTHKSKKKKRDRSGEPSRKKQKLCAIPVTIETTVNTPGLNESSFVPPVFDNSTWKDGYVYVGSLRAEVINNMLRCPAHGCFKNFRTNILLQMHIKYYHKELIALMGSTPNVVDLASARTATEPDVQLKTKSKTKSKQTKRVDSEAYSDALQKEMGYLRYEVEKIPTLESPRLRKALVGKRKRPKVLLPVRKAETAEPKEMEAECSFREEFERKFGPSAECMKELDFETEISAHTVSKSGDDRKKMERFGKGGVSTASEEDDFGSDTMSSYQRSASPEGKLDLRQDRLQDRTKEGELYYTSETGERIKIVHMKREEIINCHCGFREEDGLMIQCELCLCWQHALCHNIQKESEVPEKYTCSICLNPRRGRRSRRFVHDQDRLYEGLLPGAAPSQNLRRAHELSGNLLRIADALHALRVQRYVATQKYHPKLQLWSTDWENDDMGDKYDEYDLNSIIKEDLADIRLPGDDDKGLSQRSDGSHSLANLLDGSGTPFDLPISSDFERLAKSVQEVDLTHAADADIQDSTCRQRLLLHVQKCQARIDARLDSIEAQVAELESQDPSLVDDETADYYPRTKQTIQMMLRDLDTMEELGVIT